MTSRLTQPIVSPITDKLYVYFICGPINVGGKQLKRSVLYLKF